MKIRLLLHAATTALILLLASGKEAPKPLHAQAKKGIAYKPLLENPHLKGTTLYMLERSVPNVDLTIRWVNGHQVIWRKKLLTLEGMDSLHEYFLYDAKAGSQRSFFKSFSMSGDNRKIRLDDFLEAEGRYYARSRDGRVWSVNTKDEDLQQFDAQKSEGFELEQTLVRRSSKSNQRVVMYFRNSCKESIELFWVDERGQERSYGDVKPGALREMSTYSNHLWLIKNKKGTKLGYYLTPKFLGVVKIDSDTTLRSRAPNKGPRVESVNGKTVNVRDAKGKSKPVTFAIEEGSHIAWPARFSPDGRYLVMTQRFPAQRHPVTITGVKRDSSASRVETYDYLKPGDKIRQDRFLLYDLKRKKQIAVSNELYKTPWNLTHFAWADDSKSFSFLYNQRGHQIMRLLRMNAKDGAVSTVIEERSKTFIDYSQKTYLRRLKDGGVIWMSERDGWNHLYLFDGSDPTSSRQLTKGKWVVRSVERVDEEKGELLIRAMGVHPKQDPYHIHYGIVDIKRGGVRWLTSADATHQLTFSPTSEYFLDKYSRVDLLPQYEVSATQGKGDPFRIHATDESELKRAKWKAPVRFTAKGRDGKTDIYGYILFPSWLKEGDQLPVLESIYAGPHGHHVRKSFRLWSSQRELCERGFIIVKIDGMGTNWRSKAFHDVCWKNLGDSGFPDRMAWIKAAAKKYPAMDLNRVGIYGGSAGGQSALRALLAHGDFYHAAAADCGCHDNRVDKIWWNEAWMGWPIGDHYKEQSNVTNAWKLKGKLLLTVGAMDRNVDPVSTMQVVQALIEHDKEFELMVFPSGGHGIGESRYGKALRERFFLKHFYPE